MCDQDAMGAKGWIYPFEVLERVTKHGVMLFQDSDKFRGLGLLKLNVYDNRRLSVTMEESIAKAER